MNNYYQWTGIDAQGKKISGALFAKNKLHAKSLIEKKCSAILSVKFSLSWSCFIPKAINDKNKLDILQHIYCLLEVGIPIADALSLLLKSTQSPILKNILVTLHEKLLSGDSFSHALRLFPEQFDHHFCQLISVGEQSGKLNLILSQLIIDTENKIALKRKMIQAVTYPISVLVISIIVCFALCVFILPQFQLLYHNFGGQLPAITTMVISLSMLLREHGFLFLNGCITLFFIAKKILARDEIHRRWHAFALRIPLVASAIMAQQMMHWSRSLFITLSTGMALTDALTIANQVITNTVLQRAFSPITQAVIQGKSLHDALSHCRYFPERASYLISIGESADALPAMIQKIATLYQNTTQDLLNRLSKLLEPVIMIGVAGLISGLIIAMYLPVFRMGSIV
ncbi:MAG: hypothetical protein A3I77_06320 [Gammaproteobacteria bacterium RIFCSPLOWO2_02_FULL_42_14]|nr:MAG: hypothetical protein A3B71_06915 [Gammaproteobacteria bacterium RIFCSPHIGHO2_02_FULL_42_43]OGT29235.1 MAG: hypothetical protein A2624_05385 [Gammaproteobacteria bacterium RIFCSPHIGHO2_01_FULL_42_8]OGT52610.1 MAG: hypothetical protein A3E54_06515 [Gammaproteobacteria bacterium RIFCSPHIGHO2_12_FULL_41_25]OGT63208.1 MAG: hypothetical protein A3I77_06320 [Gammaproteobacteria bacterium RIFCSPLOWO2_02_FULL_42_14]OGT86709.1 MAG: hypothetical protein A3G86_05145 [Gammaproteobacteria bacterium R